MKHCIKCNQTKPFSDFYKRNGRKSDYWSYCIPCERKRQAAYARAFKEKCLSYKGIQACEKCGYDRSIVALDFHHTDPKAKEFQISKLWRLGDWEKAKSELDKCVVWCANCHREHHLSNGADGE